ncbi:MAG TPA: thioesterase family protein [Pseudomonadales bacterium]
MVSIPQLDPLYHRDGERFVPAEFCRGPWDPGAQHGGAPAALLVTLAEGLVAEPDWQVVRLTMELMRPVPLAPLSVATEAGRGRTVRRIALTLSHETTTVARATVLLQRCEPLGLPAPVGRGPLRPPAACTEPASFRGMPTGTAFHSTAMETRLESELTGGRAAAWFRLAVPVLPDTPPSPAARAVAAADFGNGISTPLPFDEYLFTNPDLTVYLHRPADGEWIGVASETVVEPTGIGLTRTTLYDLQGPIGVAQQDLVIRRRP